MADRLKLTLLALVAMLVTMFGLVPLVLTLVSLPLMVIWVGVPMLLASTWLARHFLNFYRYWAGRVLNRVIIRPYQIIPAGGWFARVRWIVTDSATWRDILWILINCTAGFGLLLLPVILLLGTVFYLIFPFLVSVTPPGVFTTAFGIFHLRNWIEGFWLWPVAGLLFGLWWRWTPSLLQAWSTLTDKLLGPSQAAILAGRVASLAASRADTIDSAAAEIRRLERDLHDGVQVRLVSLGMSLGLADELMESDPAKARELVAEAAAATSSTLAELRNLVRGIHPPVLADRGLLGAARALALETPISSHMSADGFGDGEEIRLTAPVEACAYFVISEGLANIVKHARASHVSIRIVLADRLLRVIISDDGVGGARIGQGTGLRGLVRRLAAFDGTLKVTSPTGGPTLLTMEMPCEPLSPKTTPSSEKA